MRTRAREILAALSREACAAASEAIRRHIGTLAEWQAAGTVAFYAAQPSEPDLAPLLDTPGKEFCFPRTAGAALEFHRCHTHDLLRPGPWKLREPDPAHCPVIPAAGIDLLFIPGLAFTREGGRLGRGGGYYDRFLSRTHPRAVKIGVCFHSQLAPSLPLEMHDLEMDLVVTENEVFRAR
ncbi:MAG TPA: 5-formyltetrahydrofolate cyclo-ligase [Chthoniobacteraceae bacterium]|nr:5-formyltetrahydrofolate cyclo-ligase [Chthoniobacteraceae bacterium]